VIFACDKFRSYIVDSKVTVHTDHLAIKYIMKQKDAKPGLIRWVLLLQEFDLHIVERKGEDNPVADHLSRMENIPNDPIPINDSFSNEQLANINVSSIRVASPCDEGMTPRSSILVYLVPAKEEARSKNTRSPQGPTLRLGIEGKNYL
jgi:hypothetical protein